MQTNSARVSGKLAPGLAREAARQRMSRSALKREAIDEFQPGNREKFLDVSPI